MTKNPNSSEKETKGMPKLEQQTKKPANFKELYKKTQQEQQQQ